MAGRPVNQQFNPERFPFYQSEGFEEANAQLDFFQFVVEVITDPVFLLHSDSQILYVNQAAADHLEYSVDELLGKYVWEWDPNMSEEDWPGMFQATVDGKHLHFETMHTTKSGKRVPIEIHSYYYARDNEEFAVCICKIKT